MTTPSVSSGQSPTTVAPAASSSRFAPPPSPSRPLLGNSHMPPSTPYIPSSHPGCVLCGLVASAASQVSNRPEDDDSATTASFAHEAEASTSRSRGFGITRVGEREIVYRDHEITVYPATGKERLCPEGRHLIVVLNRHVESVYDLVSLSETDRPALGLTDRQGPSDIPLLSHILSTAEDLLYALPGTASDTERAKQSSLRVGFVAPIMRQLILTHSR